MQQIQIPLVIVLIGVLAASVVFFVILGLRRTIQARRLSGQSERLGLRFSRTDPFDIPRRYNRFALISAGHSPVAENVSHGWCEGRPIRTFHFRYEVGHGTRRMTRAYRIFIARVGFALPELLMWNDLDVEEAPLEARRVDGRIGCWTRIGDPSLCTLLARAAEPAGADGMCIQTMSNVLMLFLPEGKKNKKSLIERTEQFLKVFRVVNDIAAQETPETV